MWLSCWRKIDLTSRENACRRLSSNLITLIWPETSSIGANFKYRPWPLFLQLYLHHRCTALLLHLCTGKLFHSLLASCGVGLRGGQLLGLELCSHRLSLACYFSEVILRLVVSTDVCFLLIRLFSSPCEIVWYWLRISAARCAIFFKFITIFVSNETSKWQCKYFR